ncbi:hypothetical protein [Salisediminibacterium selenitireducens]|nr:hypothetical protein [Salisediminibacterium selenitireducens]
MMLAYSSAFVYHGYGGLLMSVRVSDPDMFATIVLAVIPIVLLDHFFLITAIFLSLMTPYVVFLKIRTKIDFNRFRRQLSADQ